MLGAHMMCENSTADADGMRLLQYIHCAQHQCRAAAFTVWIIQIDCILNIVMYL
jgi:hypothetical protein